MMPQVMAPPMVTPAFHPAILCEAGLAPALKTLARRSPVRVELDLRIETRLPERVEVAASCVVSEALTNAVKHANASAVHVAVDVADRMARLSVRDDGVGGADPARGSGQAGLKDRVAAAGGTLTVHSHPGQGTHLVAEVPAAAESGSLMWAPSCSDLAGIRRADRTELTARERGWHNPPRPMWRLAPSGSRQLASEAVI